MSLLIYVTEAFTIGNNDPFTGNPAAVVILQYDNEIGAAAKQKIANTLNVGATVFVSLGWEEPEDKKSRHRPQASEKVISRKIRWFTPTEELPICGHGTVGACQALLDLYANEKAPRERVIETIHFETKVRGTVSASITTAPEGNKELITLNFPTNSVSPVDLNSDWLPDLARAILGPEFPEVIENIQEVFLCTKEGRIVLRLKRDPTEDPEVTLRKVKPDFHKLSEAKAGEMDVTGAIVTIEGCGRDSSGPQYYSRNFIPALGVNEDFATGSIHTYLAPYWTKALGLEGKTLFARQASSRGGEAYCLVDQYMVRISGSARVFSKGNLII